MKKMFCAIALLIVATSVIGCKASADVDPHGATSISLPR